MSNNQVPNRIFSTPSTATSSTSSGKSATASGMNTPNHHFAVGSFKPYSKTTSSSELSFGFGDDEDTDCDSRYTSIGSIFECRDLLDSSIRDELSDAGSSIQGTSSSTSSSRSISPPGFDMFSPNDSYSVNTNSPAGIKNAKFYRSLNKTYGGEEKKSRYLVSSERFMDQAASTTTELRLTASAYVPNYLGTPPFRNARSSSAPTLVIGSIDRMSAVSALSSANENKSNHLETKADDSIKRPSIRMMMGTTNTAAPNTHARGQFTGSNVAAAINGERFSSFVNNHNGGDRRRISPSNFNRSSPSNGRRISPANDRRNIRSPPAMSHRASRQTSSQLADLLLGRETTTASASGGTPSRNINTLGADLIVWRPDDQENSKTIQERVVADSSFLNRIFHNIKMNTQDIIVDPFGNYMFQVIFKQCSVTQQMDLTSEVAANMYSACFDLRGSRCIQSMLQNMKTPGVAEIIAHALENPSSLNRLGRNRTGNSYESSTFTINRLCVDAHGNHVIQKSLQYMPFHLQMKIIDTICEDVWNIASARFGCYVVQRCFDACSNAIEEERRAGVTENGIDDATFLLNKLVRNISLHIVPLAQHSFGNYCAQYLVEHADAVDVEYFIEPLKTSLMELSDSKYGSNFVEKCLDRIDVAPLKELLIEELLHQDSCFDLIRRQYSHFVIIHAVKKFGKSDDGGNLCGTILNLMSEHYSLQVSVRGKKVLTAIYDVFSRKVVEKILMN